jgi:uroporphyrin-III C-methyltransferase
MGKAAAGTVSARLIAAGLAGDTPVALVENASLPSESILLTRLDLLALSAKAALGDGPALILVGRALAEAQSMPRSSVASKTARAALT